MLLVDISSRVDSQKCTRDHHRVFINRREGHGLEGEAPDYKTYLYLSVRIEDERFIKG